MTLLPSHFSVDERNLCVGNFFSSFFFYFVLGDDWRPTAHSTARLVEQPTAKLIVGWSV